MQASHRFWLPLLIVLAGALVFWPGLSGGFIFDDFNNIQLNRKIQIESLDAASLRRAAGAYEAGTYGRPVATISFAIDHYFSGKDPRGYKLTNLAVHLLNSVLVYLLVLRLLGVAQAPQRTQAWIAFSTALAWAAHPLQVSTVMYVVQRMEMLAATFVFLALLAYLRGRTLQQAGKPGWGWLVGSTTLAGMGMLSKESAILFPAFALTLELTLLRFQVRDGRTSPGLKLAFGLIVAAAVVVYLGYVVPRYLAPHAYDGRDFTAIERVLTQLRVLPMHLGQMVLPSPSGMAFYYDDLPISSGLFSPWTTLAGGAGLLLLAASAWLTRKSKPLFSLGILWFFVAHSMTSNIINLEMAFEHRNYIALLGIILALADVIRRLPMADSPRLKVFAVSVVILFLAGLTTLRSATWGDELLLATYHVAKNPQSPRAGHDMATIYANMSGGVGGSPFYQFAIREFERTSRLPGSSPLPEQGLIILAATAGEAADAAWWDSMVRKVKSQPLGPEQVMAVTGLMQQHGRGLPIDTRRLDEAYTALLDRGQWPGYMYAQFGDFVLTNFNDQRRAEHLFVKAVTANPEDTEFNARVLSTLISDGHVRQADAVLKALGAPRQSGTNSAGGDG